MGFNPLKIVRSLFGGGPLVKAEGISDQIGDKQAERRFGRAAEILAALVGLAFVIWAIRGC
jgi:hypothetical protein